MTSPINIVCPAGVWTKVAENVTNAIVKRLDNRPNTYLETYRATGEAAPANNDGANPIDSTGELIVDSADAIDVYIQPVGLPGEVRVDS